MGKLSVGERTVTYTAVGDNRAEASYSLEICFGDGEDITGREVIDLGIDSRGELTRDFVERRLDAWVNDNPEKTIVNYLIRESSVCRFGQLKVESPSGTDSPTETGTSSNGEEEIDSAVNSNVNEVSEVEENPSPAVSTSWEDLDYDQGDEIEYQVGGMGNSVYGTETGEISELVGTDTADPTFRVDTGEQLKRVPGEWIIGTVDE